MSILIYKQRHRHPNYKKTPKGNYAHIGYIATRPGAVKNEGMRHGLFGKLEPGVVKEFDTWQEAARLVRELSYRRVNMYRGIISFSPETAAELGLSDHKAWEDYIDRHILTLAKFNGIRVQDLQWVAAHHNEKGHPHIHVVFWNKHQRTMVPFVHPSIPDIRSLRFLRSTAIRSSPKRFRMLSTAQERDNLTVWHDSMENCWTRTERSRFTTARITNTFWTLPSRFRQGVVTT